MAGIAHRTERPPGRIAPSRPQARKSRAAEHERQFRELLEHCPAGLNIVDEEGRLVFHNARLRELMGYDEQEMYLLDTKRFWHDLDHRSRILGTLRDRGGQVLNEEVTWKTKQGEPVHLLVSYVQVAYQGGHISFAGGKRILWVYDITSLKTAEEARRRSEQRLVEAIESISEGSCSTTRRTGSSSAIPAIGRYSTAGSKPN